MQLIVMLPSQCRDSGDIKCIRNMCDMIFLGYLNIAGGLCNAAILELKFCIVHNPEVIGT